MRAHTPYYYQYNISALSISLGATCNTLTEHQWEWLTVGNISVSYLFKRIVLVGPRTTLADGHTGSPGGPVSSRLARVAALQP